MRGRIVGALAASVLVLSGCQQEPAPQPAPQPVPQQPVPQQPVPQQPVPQQPVPMPQPQVPQAPQPSPPPESGVSNVQYLKSIFQRMTPEQQQSVRTNWAKFRGTQQEQLYLSTLADQLNGSTIDFPNPPVSTQEVREWNEWALVN